MLEPESTWFEGYFDEAFIELYRPFLTAERTTDEAAAVLELLELEPGARVLDLACGWGRHSVELARAGLEVTGLDLSETLLARAAKRAEAAGVSVEWVRGDMRELPWRGRFDAVVSLFSSLGYFLSDEEDLRVLRASACSLKPGGLFVLETMHRDQIARGFVERDWWRGEAGRAVWVEREFDAVAGITREWLFFERADGSRGEKYHAMQVRTATEWDHLLRSAGLAPLAWYGDWDFSEFTHESERLIVLAEVKG
jgi:cyclopropane fatty-acyl-phospholipid synthase-like methyltransferase